MKYIFLIGVLLSSGSAHAGFVSAVERFCQAFNLIGDDPQEFENAEPIWIQNQIRFLEIRETWGKITADEASKLKRLRKQQALNEEIDRLIQTPKSEW